MYKLRNTYFHTFLFFLNSKTNFAQLQFYIEFSNVDKNVAYFIKIVYDEQNVTKNSNLFENICCQNYIFNEKKKIYLL